MMARASSMRIWVTLSLVVLSSLFLYESLSLSNVAGKIPQWVISITLFLLLVQLLIDLTLTDNPADTGSGPDEPPGDDAAELSERRKQRRRFANSVFWIALLCVLVWLLGLIAGPCFFSLVWLRFSKRESWPVSVTYSIVLALIVSAVFALMLGVVLYSGVLGELLL